MILTFLLFYHLSQSEIFAELFIFLAKIKEQKLGSYLQHRNSSVCIEVYHPVIVIPEDSHYYYHHLLTPQSAYQNM